MNDDLISRDAVLKQISCWVGSGEYRYAMPERFLIDRLIDLPPVNPQEPKTGHWIDDNGIYAWCSCCKEHIYQTGEFKYCPNCGARMESGG